MKWIWFFVVFLNGQLPDWEHNFDSSYSNEFLELIFGNDRDRHERHEVRAAQSSFVSSVSRVLSFELILRVRKVERFIFEILR